MKKFWVILFIALVLFVGLSGKADTVQAKNAKQLKTAESATVAKTVHSCGNMIYRESRGETKLCAEDFIFLWDKLSTIPETIFDPGCYTHTHKWEYRDINEKTHTRHCESCGAAHDLKSVHIASREEDYPIACDGKTYSGRRYTCVCGYQWVREEAHELVFEAVNETNHRIRCALQDTGFCRGFEPVEEEHYAYVCVPCADGAHHKIICMDCGYIVSEEECRFTQKPNPDEGDDRDSSLLYCECGNGQGKSEEPEEAAGSAETSSDPAKESASSGTPEESTAGNEEKEESASSEETEAGPSEEKDLQESSEPSGTEGENPSEDTDTKKNPASFDASGENPAEDEDPQKNPELLGTPEESPPGD